MAKIKIMTKETLHALHDALKSEGAERIVQYYRGKIHPESWLEKELGMKPFVEIDMECETPELLLSKSERGSFEAENAKTLFSALKLNDSFATDNRLWAGLSHTVYFEFVAENIKYINKNGGVLTAEDIIERFIFPNESARGYILNLTLPRLWYIGRFFYRENNPANPFYLLDEVSQDINFYTSRIMTVNLFNNPRMVELFIRCRNDAIEKLNIPLNRPEMSSIVRYLNALAGTYVIDMASDEFLYQKLMSYIQTSFSTAQEPQLTPKIEKTIDILNSTNGFVQHNELHQYMQKDKTLNSKMRKSIKDFVNSECKNDKPRILHKIVIGDKVYITVKDKYASDSTLSHKNAFFNEFVGSLQGDARIAYNVLSAIGKQTVKQEDLVAFSSHFSSIYGADFDAERTLTAGLKVLVDATIVSKKNGVYTNNILKAHRQLDTVVG